MSKLLLHKQDDNERMKMKLREGFLSAQGKRDVLMIKQGKEQGKEMEGVGVVNM